MIASRTNVECPLQAVSGALYRIFYTYVPLLAGSATGKRGTQALPAPLEEVDVRSRGNFQTFDIAAGTVVNEAR
jgi:hypothetical protein